ncbi:GNAT family protein [Mesorhizobium sp. BE184]|uniref:GNAT family N-acetyltransferase n=1 Tax=Mesorhizobium sp. BE184 TaxID=2817714 RepID=UPI002862980E|nr:GNAT family protein [Mesorhizobium sp. BE184]MDR7032435.1 RimJ/RimL family protein N-acetyltransferase [Mesorhizobium sp. BE184]
MKIVDDERVAAFVGERVGRIIYPPYTAMGIERDGKVVAGAVFNCFTGPDIHVSIAGSGWTKGFLAEVGHYVFSSLKCCRITVETEQAAVVRIAERLGGQVEGLARNKYGPGRDGFLVGILKEDYPW